MKQLAAALIATLLPFITAAQSLDSNTRAEKVSAALKALTETCNAQGSQAVGAVMGRDRGIPKEQFIKALPPLTEQARASYDILDDVYRLKDLNDSTLYFYRVRVCQYETIVGKRIAYNNPIDDLLLKCQTDNANQRDKLGQCVLQVIADNSVKVK